jgi:alpha-N-acetylglucosaminidase
MKKILLVTLLVLANSHGWARTYLTEAKALIERVTPTIAQQFKVELISDEKGLDVYELESKGGKIVLRGNNGVSLASAYNRYLQDYCKVQYSLWGDQMKLPTILPVIDKKIRVVNARKVRHFFNYCTFNYSATWWNWERWEKMIDILAMNGVNMPLSIVGVEGVWYNSLLEVGFTDLEAREFIAAPIYLNWQWMSNLEGTGGPIPKHYIDTHIKLGRKIMDRQIGYGMTPIVHGFSGHVPRLFKKKFPKARIDIKRGWAQESFNGAAQLDPMDPLFTTFGKIYLKNQIRLLGTGHYYMVDPFHEGAPPVSGKAYLAKVARNISKLFSEVDPKAIWAMQTWSMREAIVKAIPKDKLLIMNLHGNRWKQLEKWGYKFTQGQLNNFGGRTFMHGDLEVLAKDVFTTIKKQAKNCVGVGNWAEGINDNPVNYHLGLDMNWAEGPIDLKEWLKNYAIRRYGVDTPEAAQAWELLLKGPYSRGAYGYSSMLCGRPGLRPPKAGTNRNYGSSYFYDSRLVAQAWELLQSIGDKAKSSEGYRFDLVDVARQSLSNLVAYKQCQLTNAFDTGDREKLKKAGDEMIELIEDIDELISSCPQMLMGRWQQDAMAWATNEEEKAYYKSMAATLPTIWGADKPTINLYDYAWREWGGLVNTFYKKRWELWISELDAKMAAKKSYMDPSIVRFGRPLFRADDIHSKLADFEVAYAANPPDMNPKAVGDSLAISRRLWKKYKEQLLKIRKVWPRYNKSPISLSTPVYKWDKNWATKDYKTVRVDISKFITGQGEYQVRFVSKKGQLEMKNLKLIENELVIGTDPHRGPSYGGNSYHLTLKQHNMGAKFELEVDVKIKKPNPELKGIIYLRTGH